MKTLLAIISVLSVLVALSLPALGQKVRAAEPGPTSFGTAMQARLDAFHEKVEENGEKLRVVYFHPADTEPQANFKDRVHRIMLDIRRFYQDEMMRHGFKARPLPLEIDGDGRLEIHLVKGQDPGEKYTYENDGKVRAELEKALEGVVDFDNDFVLVLGGMCQKREDGSYFFHAPYYGSGNIRRGICWAADCELLDPQNLTDTSTRMRYLEHYGPRDQTVAKFNSFYLGGIAHELGHGLSLPHNGQWPDQIKQHGQALMGMGNLTYRNEIWKKGKGNGSFMTRASCAILAAHPLFTGSGRKRDQRPEVSFPSLDFEYEKGSLRIHGKAKTSVEPVAVIAWTDPDGHAAYDAKTWIAKVEKDGTFDLSVTLHDPGSHELRLQVLCANGGRGGVVLRYPVDWGRRPDASTLKANFLMDPIEKRYLSGKKREALAEAQELLKTDPPELAVRKLKHLVSIAAAQKALELSEVKEDSVYLSDVNWKEAELEWAKPARNHMYHSRLINKALLFDLGGKFHEKGLYAHAKSRYVFELAGKWTTFRSTVGLQSGAPHSPGAVFIIKADGKEFSRTKELNGMQTHDIEIPVQGVKTLELIVESATETNAGCWSVWGSPRLTR